MPATTTERRADLRVQDFANTTVGSLRRGPGPDAVTRRPGPW
ncbi:hypothetical protein [Kitasatospora sp. NPDC092286]